MPARPPRSPSRTAPRGRSTAATAGSAQRALERRIVRLTAERETLRRRHARRLAALQRAADRRLARLLKEITALRHHEARAEALIRLLAERDTALAERGRRIAELEELLRSPTHLR